MYRSVYDLKAFYNGTTGRVVRRILQTRIRKLWPDVRHMSVMGLGYAAPYLRVFKEEGERVFAVMPDIQGAHHWPQQGDDKNMCCLSEASALPLENSSLDRILLIHDLEFYHAVQPSLKEIWRVLKPNGRLLVVVPNRSGWWTRADWTPFGLGSPYSHTQICYYLRDHGFVHERSEKALFFPPTKRPFLLKFAGALEMIGPYLLPFFAGLHMVEVSKQVFASIDKGSGSAVRARVPDGVLGRPVPQSYTPSSLK